MTATRAHRATRTKIPPLAELVDTRTACQLTGHTRRHLYRMTADGRLPVFKLGGRNRYWTADLQSLVTRSDGAE